MQRRIAYVEDDDVIRENYSDILKDEGFDVTAYSSKEDALAAFGEALPDLALLDVSLNGERDAGFQLCSELRRMSTLVPIVFLTSYDGEIDRISGLRLGADDYITKDASITYIIVRIEALFRRLEALSGKGNPPSGGGGENQGNGMVLDDTYSMVHWKGRKIDLSLTQFWIIRDLYTHPGKVRSHRDLMKAANIVVEQNTIAVHVKFIRDAFAAIDEGFACIRTERGRGYRWVAERQP